MAMRVYGLRDQHQALLIDLDRLHLMLAAPHGALEAVRMEAVLRREVSDLAAALEYHFGCEERDGYMRRAVVERPELASQVEQLQEQHGAILGRLDTAAGPGRALSDVRTDLAEILDLIADHESAESAVLQSTTASDRHGTGSG